MLHYFDSRYTVEPNEWSATNYASTLLYYYVPTRLSYNSQNN